jgi:cysteine desulfuration protein SufE
MKNIPASLQNIIKEFREIEDQQLKTDLLIEFGEKFQSVPEHVSTRPFPEKNRVKSCESEAYIFTEKNTDGSLNFYFAVENPQGISAKAMAYILQSTLSGQDLKLVSNISEDIAYDIFGKGLSMGKGLGLTGMIKMLRDIALDL